MTECQDRFVVCGKVYQDFREMMAKVIVTQEINPLAKLIQVWLIVRDILQNKNIVVLQFPSNMNASRTYTYHFQYKINR